MNAVITFQGNEIIISENGSDDSYIGLVSIFIGQTFNDLNLISFDEKVSYFKKEIEPRIQKKMDVIFELCFEKFQGFVFSVRRYRMAKSILNGMWIVKKRRIIDTPYKHEWFVTIAFKGSIKKIIDKINLLIDADSDESKRVNYITYVKYDMVDCSNLIIAISDYGLKRQIESSGEFYFTYDGYEYFIERVDSNLECCFGLI